MSRGAEESGEDGMHGCKRAGGVGCRVVLRSDGRTSHMHGICLHLQMAGIPCILCRHPPPRGCILPQVQV